MLAEALLPRWDFNFGPGHGFNSLTPRTVIDYATLLHDKIGFQEGLGAL